MPPVTSTNQIAPCSLADYTSADSLHLRLEGRNVRAVMEELIGVPGREACPAAVLHAAMKSLTLELLTGRVDASAVRATVHLPGETRPRFFLGRAPELLPWRASKLTPIEFVILLVEPPPGDAEGRRVWAGLARLIQDHDRLDALRMAQSAAEMLAVLDQVAVLANELDTALQPAVLQREAKQSISPGTLSPGPHCRRQWRATQNVVCQP